jgi:capsular polysaccharide transport system permease protein
MKLSPPTKRSEPATTRPLPARRQAAAATPRPRRGIAFWFALLVLLPTLLTGVYYATYAADLYESEARFIVRGRGSSGGGASSALSGMLGGGGLGIRAGSEEIRAVSDYVLSLDAMQALRRDIDLVAIWRRPEADLLTMLWWSEPEAERLLSYYQRRVLLEFNIETGIATLRVRAFRPEDAQTIADRLLKLAETLVNEFSDRTAQDTIRVARGEVEIAEQRVLAARDALTNFREREQALDPTREAAAAMESVTRLEGALAQSRAEFQERRTFMRPDNPQIQLLTNRITALSAQIAVERSRLTQGDEMVTQRLAQYERLQLEREFADRQLASATSSLETARAEALRQANFLLRVVQPSRPEYALYPTATFNTFAVLAGLSVVFLLGWLMVVGAREHAS